MITPVTVIVAIDGSTKLREHVANISQLLNSALETLMINDDLGLVLITDITNSVFPLIIVRPQNQKNLKQDLLQELSAAQDATTRGHPSKAVIHALNLVNKRSSQDQWRPVYILLITDGRPEDMDIEQLWDMVHKNDATANEMSIGSEGRGPIFLDVYAFNHHHSKREFLKAMTALFPGTSVVRIRGRIDIIKSVWHFRDKSKQIRNSVRSSDISSSLAKRRAPGHIRIPSIFKK